MPATSETVFEEIGAEKCDFDSIFTFGILKSGEKVGEAAPLFQRIDEEKLQYIREKLKSESGMDTISIGLANVNSRLKLLYGDKYDMDISSQQGEYTKVSINIEKFLGD